ncbi:unnamed protein product, partial [Ilex paraguariensis]
WAGPGGESTLSNVDRRAAHDLETNLAKHHLLSNSSFHSCTTGRSIDCGNLVEHLGQSSNAAIREWNHTIISLPPHHMPVVS